MKEIIQRPESKKNLKDNGCLRKITSSRGMTMGELLVVVAIIIILSGVAFIGVANHQRNLALLERENTAEEIFVAAQNHLTAAEGEGYPGLVSLKEYNKTNNAAQKELKHGDIIRQSGYLEVAGTTETANDWNNQTYYIVVNNGRADENGEAMLNLMLPPRSIDETVRGGGSYIIRYNRTKGQVLDVFYCSANGTKFDHSLAAGEYKTVMEMKDNRSARKNWDGAVLGWYGGDEANPAAVSFIKPTITIDNAERLTVKVTANAGSNVTTTLQVTGVSSGAEKTFTLSETSPSENTLQTTKTYIVVLDDITTSQKQFAVLFENADSGGPFIPGEDLKIRAIDRKGSKIQYSAEKTTNSLFWGVDASENQTIDRAYINNIRHLENLDYSISNVNKNGTGKVAIYKAVQTDDLIWDDNTTEKDFVSQIHKATGVNENQVVIKGQSGTEADAGSFRPVNHKESPGLNYDGQGHSISHVKVSGVANAGLFGELESSSVKDLELIDFNISGTTTAGGLVGSFKGNVSGGTNNANNILKLFGIDDKKKGAANTEGLMHLASTTISGPSVENVLVHNSSKDGSNEQRTIKSAVAVGGLIGSAQGGCTIKNSAAAVTVSGTSLVGGLIGNVSGNSASIDSCFSGGHTDKGEFYKHDNSGVRGDAIYNVTGATAGGLIGSFSGGEIKNSYSTASVSGTSEAGGFVGTATSGSITSCYCAGMVDMSEIYKEGVSAGAFAASCSSTTTECSYLEIINERIKDNKIEYLGAVNNEEVENIKPFDEDTTSYNYFVGGRNVWAPANSYDSTPRKYYGLKFNLRTVKQLGVDEEKGKLEEKALGTTTGNTVRQFTDTHYGDWPAPEVFIINP